MNFAYSNVRYKREDIELISEVSQRCKNERISNKKPCSIMTDDNGIKNRGIKGCENCLGDGYVKYGSDNTKNCKVCGHCLKITGFCSICLDTGFKIGSSIQCDHRRT